MTCTGIHMRASVDRCRCCQNIVTSLEQIMPFSCICCCWLPCLAQLCRRTNMLKRTNRQALQHATMTYARLFAFCASFPVVSSTDAKYLQTVRSAHTGNTSRSLTQSDGEALARPDGFTGLMSELLDHQLQSALPTLCRKAFQQPNET